MRYLPLFKNMKGQPCLVVGGGAVAERKIAYLRRAAAAVTVIAPDISPSLKKLSETGEILIHQRPIEAEDIHGFSLVFSATGIEAVDRMVSETARAKGIDVCAVDSPDHSSFIVPAIVDRDPVMVAVSSGGTMPVLAREIRARLETLLPARLGDAALAAWKSRSRVRASLPDCKTRRDFWTRQARKILAGGNFPEKALHTDDHQTGRVSIVGAGPGDPDLLTLKAVQRLQEADVILYDRLVTPEIIGYARRDAERIDVGKAPGRKGYSQDAINALMAHRAEAGQHVVRLKGGDPFIFGRGGEERDYLTARNIPVDIVPGITAALGCAAAENISLTHRGESQSVTLLTGVSGGKVAPQDWAALAQTGGTLVTYMGANSAGQIREALIYGGLAIDTPVAIIENGTREDSRRLNGTVGDLDALAGLVTPGNPALMIIGKVAAHGIADVVTAEGLNMAVAS